ncbi:MAG: hypothetical protein H7Y03_08415 [Chitinophagaceae bacterium]|nr:hypothetical protein [Chitinophagaceae bacterium]
MDVSKKDLEIGTTNSYIYGESAVAKTNNDFYSLADIVLFRKRQTLYYWGLINYEKSYSLKIDRRLQRGIGNSI